VEAVSPSVVVVAVLCGIALQLLLPKDDDDEDAIVLMMMRVA
jgi:hypothetical protein